MKLGLALLALALAGPALAQTTICGEEFGKWVCRTQSPPPNIFASGMAAFDAQTQRQQQVRRDRDASIAAERQSAQIASEESRALNAQHVRELVGDQLAQGHCPYARTLALQAGDMDLAEQADRLCKPAP